MNAGPSTRKLSWSHSTRLSDSTALIARMPKRIIDEAAITVLGMLTNIASNFRMEPPTIMTTPVVTVIHRLPTRLARTMARLLGYVVEENVPSSADTTALTDCPKMPHAIRLPRRSAPLHSAVTLYSASELDTLVISSRKNSTTRIGLTENPNGKTWKLNSHGDFPTREKLTGPRNA